MPLEDSGKISQKEKDDAIKRIDGRIAELHRQEEESSHNIDHGNHAEPLVRNEYSPKNRRTWRNYSRKDTKKKFSWGK